jgi:sugar phosphate isomerase/epimerase
MLKRRQFLKQSGAAMVGGILFSNNSIASFLGNPAQRAIGIQLYTFFSEIDKDTRGTLKRIAAIGYKEIESAFSRKGGFYGMKAKEFAAMLKEEGLEWKSHHVIGAPFKLPPGAKPPVDANGKPLTIPPMRNLRDNYQELVDEAAEGGVKYLVCSSTPITTADDIKSSIEVLNKTGEACKKAGMQFAYHNHDAEFRMVEGLMPYDLFLAQTDADKVKMELDLAWVTKGGKDPVELFKQHPGRFPLWHVKDIDAAHEKVMPVGSGSIDFKRILDAAQTSGMQHIFVEHDMPADPFASVESSFKHLSGLLKN